jgi:4'-phosphopantetheinyl transferase
MTFRYKWSSPPDVVYLQCDEVHLWRAFLDADLRLPPVETDLSSDELNRAARLAFPRDRYRLTARRQILRDILGKYLRRAASQVSFIYESEGKPEVSLTASDPPIRFNVSHSHGLAMYAIALHREIGLDIEAIRPDVPFRELASQFFTCTEMSEFQSIPDDKQSEAFFRWWSRKEAYVKAVGRGLSLPLNSFDVSVSPEAPAYLHSRDSGRWTIRDFQPEDGYAGAVVVEGKEFTLQLWNYV